MDLGIDDFAPLMIRGTAAAKPRVGENGGAAGVDPAPRMIAIAHRKANRAALRIDFLVGVIESLAFSDGTFDAVTSSLTMHHLPKHVRVEGLAQIKRVLRPDGRILIADVIRPSGPFFKRFSISPVLHHGWGLILVYKICRHS